MTALAPARLTFRLHRFEAVAFGLLAVTALVLSFVVAARLDAVGYGPECAVASRTGAATPPSCDLKINVFYGIASSEGGLVSAMTLLVGFTSAVLVGVVVVGREIERGTTRLAWALASSRLRWLRHRLVPVLLFVTALGLMLGLGADRLLAAREPGMDVANSLEGFGSRGAVLGARVVFVFSLAVAAGAVLGRVLPALIVAGLLAAIGIAGGAEIHDRMIAGEAVLTDDVQLGDRWIDQRFRLPDGRIIGWDEVERYDPPPTDPNTMDLWPTLPQVVLAVPGTRYAELAAREVAALAGGTLVALAITVVAVLRRRPG
jgi:hypothetical protein